MSSNVPLLNEYKKEFVLRRCLQTFLGGVNLRLGYAAPPYVYLVQLTVWLTPWIIGGVFTVATQYEGINILTGSLVTGCLVGLFVLCLQGTLFMILRQKTNVSLLDDVDVKPQQQQFNQLLAEEDEVYFDSCCSYTTMSFTVPPKRFSLNIFFHALLSGLLCGMGFWYSLPTTLTALYNSTATAVILFIFSWITIIIAQFPLTAGGVPPEVATFMFAKNYEVTSMSRMFHVFIFYSFHIVEVYVPSFQAVNQVLHILFACLPLLWSSGLLPPMDAILQWAAEQLLIFALGGSPVSCDLRLFVTFFLSGATFAGACFLSGIEILTLFCVALGFLLSTNTTGFIIDVFSKLISSCTEREIAVHSDHLSSAKPSLSLLTIMWNSVVFILNILVSAVCIFYRSSFSSNPKLALQVVFIVLVMVTWIFLALQKVYICFRTFRSCIYPQSYSSILAFQKRKQLLHVFGYIHLFLTTVAVPLLIVAYLSIFLLPSATTVLPSALHALATVHAYRMTWQRSNGTLLNLAIIAVLDIIHTYSVQLVWFGALPLGVQLLFMDVVVDRIFRFLDNTWFAFALVVTSWTDKKQRRKSSVPFIAANVFFLPVVLGFVALASALAAPLLPLFTLPIFFVAFPRPSRFWPLSPGSATPSVCSDTAYYRQMASGVTENMAKGSYLGVFQSFESTGTDLSMFLLRSQDKTLWVQELERGYGYVAYSVKGLELQETSCHALEATRIDDACEAAFEKADTRANVKRLNPYPILSGVTPLDTFYVESYSDAKNSLAGIIDRPEALDQIHRDFVKSLIWMLVRYSKTTGSKQHDMSGLVSEEPTPLHSKRKETTGTSASAFADGKSETSAAEPTVISLETLGNASRKPSKRAGAGTKRKDSNLSGSLGSLASILASEDGRASRSRAKSRPGSGNNSVKLPGSISDEEDEEEWEAESNFSDSGFGLPAVDVSRKKKPVNDKKPRIAETNLSSAFHHDWLQVPTSDNDLRKFDRLFDNSWYLHVNSMTEKDSYDMKSSGVEDDQLMKDCRKLAIACYVIIHVQGVPGRNPSLLGASHMCKVFTGDIPWSPDLEWLQQHDQLYQMVLAAHRYAVKLMYDRVAMGTTEDAANEDFDETAQSLLEYDTEWHIGVETQHGWMRAVESGRASLFTVGLDREKSEYSARVLIRRPVETHVTKLSAAAVRGIWANLSIELLYATNDDEERYSIQAHPSLLRNLTIQAADPPLGYPIFSSPAMFERTLPLPTITADRWVAKKIGF